MVTFSFGNTLIKKWVKLGIVCMMMLVTVLNLQISHADTELKGMWVATVYGIDYPSARTQDEAKLKADADRILNTAKAAGMNAVFLQVRPTGDAFYKSQIFPWSKFLTGQEGVAPNNGFDPLAYWITQAHAMGIELHAWINPYRVTRDVATTVTDPFALLSTNNPAKLHPEWVVRYSDGNLYYNPGLPEVENLIVSGVKELIQNYDIDGIHFDDYFYPGASFEDNAAYQKYALTGESLGDFRRRSVTHMIGAVYQAVHTLDANCVFGVSPFGIWANASHLEGGSDTNGSESYFSHYADTKAWVKSGIIDYIAPQLYWNIGYTIADYQTLATWWSNVVTGTSVKLYIGHGAYRTQNTDATSAWYGSTEIGKQIALNKTLPNIKGSIYYNYSAFKNYPELVTTVAGQAVTAVSNTAQNTTSSVSTATTTTNTGIVTSDALISGMYPQTVATLSGNSVTLSCNAPSGSIVNVNVLGRYYFLKATNTVSTGAMATYTVEVPSTAFASAVTYRPVYRVRYQGTTYEQTASGFLQLLN